MLDQTVVVYCICDEVAKCLGIKDDMQCRMPRYIKACAERGFCLKILFFILANMVHRYFPMT